jgi:uncharacterized protein with WD repeat
MSPVGTTVDKIHHVVAFVPCKFDTISTSVPCVQPTLNFPAQKGDTGYAKLFAHPRFNPEKDVVANKSFFNVDKMDAEWSQDGKSVLLLCQSEVDKTGASYYGKTQLFYFDVQVGSLSVK